MDYKKRIPPPPPKSATDQVKAGYYAKHDPLDLLDAGYLEEDGIYQGDKRLVNLRAERGMIRIPIRAKAARKLFRAAERSGCTPAELASRLLMDDLDAKSAD